MNAVLLLTVALVVMEPPGGSGPETISEVAALALAGRRKLVVLRLGLMSNAYLRHFLQTLWGMEA